MTVRILVIEDEPSIAENISYALSADGFAVECCATIAEARVRLVEPFDLIILDVGLPDGTGFDLIGEIRGASVQTPVIFLTARSGEVDRVVGLEIGADDYMVKPFSPRELCARVRTILRRVGGDEGRRRERGTGGAGTPPAGPGEEDGARSGMPDRRYGPFIVDRQRLHITYRDAILPLTRYEYRLLLVLIESPGRVFSREQLMNRAWEEPEMSLERTVDAHIKSLRAKLRGVSSDEDPIVTHRGFGYSLREYP